MEQSMMNAIIGGIASAIGSVVLKFLAGRVAILSRYLTAVSRLQLFTLGLAFTAVVLALPPWRASDLVVVETEVIAHTNDQSYDGTWEDPTVSIPRVPAPAMFYPLDLTCRSGYTPVSTWRQIVVTHPSMDVLYTVEARLDDQGVALGLRAREDKTGYAYIKVYLLCRSSDAVQSTSESNSTGGD